MVYADQGRRRPDCRHFEQFAEALDAAHAENLHGVVNGGELVEVGVALHQGVAQLVLRYFLQDELHQQVLRVAQVSNLPPKVHDGILRKFREPAVQVDEMRAKVAGALRFERDERVQKPQQRVQRGHAAATDVADVARDVAACQAHELVVVRVVDGALLDLARLVAERRAAHAGTVGQGVGAKHLVAPAVFKDPLAAGGTGAGLGLDHFGGELVRVDALVRRAPLLQNDQAVAAGVVPAQAALVGRREKAVAAAVGAAHGKLLLDVGHDACTFRDEVVAQAHGHVLAADAVLVGALGVAQTVDLPREFDDFNLVLPVLFAEFGALLLGFGQRDGRGQPFQRELQQRLAVERAEVLFHPVEVQMFHQKIFFHQDGAVDAPREFVVGQQELADASFARLDAAAVERHELVGGSVERKDANLAFGHLGSLSLNVLLKCVFFSRRLCVFKFEKHVPK